MLAAGREGDRSHVEEQPCPVCKQRAIGQATVGSPNVLINGKKALRVHDSGKHAEGCPERAWEADEGAPAVLINSRHAHRRGDGAKHPSGRGTLMEGSPDVLIGNRIKGGSADQQGSEAHGYEGGFLLVDEDDEPLVDVPYVIRTRSGREFRGRTDSRGHTKLVFTEEQEDIEVELLAESPCSS